MGIPGRLFAVINHEGRMINHTPDEAHLRFMKTYVDGANASGDHWTLVRYDLSCIVHGPRSKKEVKEDE